MTEPVLRFGRMQEILDFVRAFETQALPRARWDHAAHLAVTQWYLQVLPESEATERVVDGIRSYNRVHGAHSAPGRGYHETITLFWLAIARRFRLEHCELDALTAVNRFVSAFGNQEDLILDYYSPALLATHSCRSTWTEPDLEPLE